jgi:hypothetical protein
MKTYYSVDYSVWGSNIKHTAWFDNKEEAYKFAAGDYRDNPVTHRVSRPEKIAQYDELVTMTQYNLNK